MVDGFKIFWLVPVLLIGLIIPIGGNAADHDRDLASVVQQLGARSYGVKIKIINKLAATGDERVVAILEAYLGRKLYRTKSGKRVVIAAGSGGEFRLMDPVTGEKFFELKKSDVKKLRLNNRVRRALRAALGGLTLVAKDPRKRLAAV